MKTTLVLTLAGLSALTEAGPMKKRASGKRGLAYNDGAFTQMFGDEISWQYNWGSTQYGNPAKDYPYVPMVHGTEIAAKGQDEMNNVLKEVEKGAKWVLSFNEPDQCGGGGTCMQVGDAIKYHKQFVQPIAEKGAKIVSPAVTNGPEPKGLAYLKSFMDGCDGCQIDAIAVHYYAWDKAEDFIAHMKKVHDMFKKPIWVTEFGVNPGEGDPEKFLKEVIPWMDKTDFIARYSYHFAAPSVPDRPYLINAEGTGLSSLGQVYASA